MSRACVHQQRNSYPVLIILGNVWTRLRVNIEILEFIHVDSEFIDAVKSRAN